MQHLSRISVQGMLTEPREGVNVIKSQSQPITARGSGGSAVSSPSGVWGRARARAANDFSAIQRLKRKHLMLYNLAFSGELFNYKQSHVASHCIIELARIHSRGYSCCSARGYLPGREVYTP